MKAHPCRVRYQVGRISDISYFLFSEGCPAYPIRTDGSPNWWRVVRDRDEPSPFVNSRHVGDGASSSTPVRIECLWNHYFKTRIIVTLLSAVYLSCLWIVATRHEPSPLWATRYESGMKVFNARNTMILTVTTLSGQRPGSSQPFKFFSKRCKGVARGARGVRGCGGIV